MKKITLIEVRYLAFELANGINDNSEPIPPFETRFPGKLESCLEQPFQVMFGETLYRGLIKKASILFYLIIKNHPFQNGNKRLAVTITLVFLIINKKWLEMDQIAMYKFAIDVAKSNPKQKDETLKYIEKTLKDHLVNL